MNVNLKKQPNSNKNRGFGFVIFSVSAEVDNVMAARPHTLKVTNLTMRVMNIMHINNRVSIKT